MFGHAIIYLKNSNVVFRGHMPDEIRIMLNLKVYSITYLRAYNALNDGSQL